MSTFFKPVVKASQAVSYGVGSLVVASLGLSIALADLAIHGATCCVSKLTRKIASHSLLVANYFALKAMHKLHRARGDDAHKDNSRSVFLPRSRV